jgi:hypothetical protein
MFEGRDRRRRKGAVRGREEREAAVERRKAWPTFSEEFR